MQACMQVITVPFEKLDPIYQRHVLDGYNYGCCCGESYETQQGAEDCRKCRTYLAETPTKVYFTPTP